MRALITGATGFVGGRLARELASEGWEVFGSSNIAARTVEPFARLIEADVNNEAAMREAFEIARPDAVFHLAAIASVADAERDPETALRVNGLGVSALLRIAAERKRTEGARPGDADVALLIVGSAEQYGSHVAAEMPLGEEAEQRPVSVYGASKCIQELLALQAHRAHGLRVICVRSFNHTGPGQGPRMVLPGLVARALELRRNGGTSLQVGNTTPVRDFLHVEEVVRAYRLLVERGASGAVYNVSSGRGLSIADMARAILRKVGVEATLTESADLVRRVDIPLLVGDNSKLQRDTGWRPVRGFDEIVEELIVAATE